MKSKVKATEKDSEFDSKYGDPKTGKLYVYKYTFEDGTEGKANHKTDAPKYKVGEEVEFEAINDEYGTKIKFIQASTFNGNTSRKFDPEFEKQKQVYIIRQSSIKAAIDFHTTHGYPTNEPHDQVIATAEIFTKYVLNGK